MFQAANYDFYVTQKNLCCRDLERIDFPVFQASVVDSHPARISPIPTPISNDVDEKIKDSNFTNSSSHGNTLSKPELSQGEFSKTEFLFVFLSNSKGLGQQLYQHQVGWGYMLDFYLSKFKFIHKIDSEFVIFLNC